MTQVIAHRGDSNVAPENTLAAIRSALALGLTLVEVDVRRTSDGVLVLMHDCSVSRTTNGSGAVDDLDWKTISTLNASADRGRFEGVPTLVQALETIVEASATLVVEVKQPAHYPAIADDLLRDLDAARARQHVVVASFDIGWLRRLRVRAPDVRIAELWIWPPPGAHRGASVVSVYWLAALVDPTLVSRLHRGGYQVWAWTVERLPAMRRLAARGIDGIITSNPSECQRVLDGKAGEYTSGIG